MLPINIYPLNEKALCIDWGNTIDEEINSNVTAINRLLLQDPFLGFIETVPAYSTLTIYYQPELVSKENGSPFKFVKNHVEALLPLVKTGKQEPSKTINIPVCYDDEFGPDLPIVAAANHLSKEEVIAVHHQKEYQVYMMGFLPGFAYMGPVDDSIATPRKQSPRAGVEQGSVGIAGKQTGIYPLQSPGGWQIIGRTPWKLFDLEKEDPFVLKSGDRVRFFPITKEEFHLSVPVPKELAPKPRENESADVLVIKPGPGSSLQDGGRWGYQSYGVPISGAMDEQSFLLANALAGNSKNYAVIECTMGGLVISFKKKAAIAVTGAGTAFINHRPIKYYQPLTVWVNDTLEIKYNHDGIRTYIAVAGGFSAPVLMNSRSSYAAAGIGQLLKKDDEIFIENTGQVGSRKMDPAFPLNVYATNPLVRIMDGPETGWLKNAGRQSLYTQDFIITLQSGRMGIRLQSDPIGVKNTTQLVSTAVTKGTVQLTPNGQLIVLMSDCQTTGGYPRIAQVAAVDLPILAQLKPGDILQFKNISYAEAEELYLLQQKKLDAFFG